LRCWWRFLRWYSSMHWIEQKRGSLTCRLSSLCLQTRHNLYAVFFHILIDSNFFT
jgi:hypothetical protein